MATFGRRRLASSLQNSITSVMAFLMGCLVTHLIMFRPSTTTKAPSSDIATRRSDVKTVDIKVTSSAEKILSDPSLFAQHLKKHFVCNLPSDAACGHDQDFFRIFERNGVHVLPVHFYSIVPEVTKLDVSKFQRPAVNDKIRSACESSPHSDQCPIPKLAGIDINLKQQIQQMEGCKVFANEFSSIPAVPQTIGGHPEFHSRWACSQHTPQGQPCTPFGALDAQVYHCMIRKGKPKTIIEIGSGHSTYVAVGAMQEAIRESPLTGTKLVAIEPYPSGLLRSHEFGVPFELIEKPLQEVDLAMFQQLQAGDILFIDSTHIAVPGSDVVHIFTKILPSLAPGVVVHVHDICLPFETAWDWTFKDYRFWNEQYLLHTFLLSNSDWEIIYMGALWEHYLPGLLSKIFPLRGSNGSFWMRKKSA